MALADKVIYQNGAIREFEKPEVCEAIKVANANRWTVALSPTEWEDREARLKKEYEKHANASDKMGMTLEEAKDILKKEFAVIGLHKSTEPFEFDESCWIEHEKPSVLEAFRVLAKEGYYVAISGHDYDMRKKRFQKEYEENTKAPGSGEEQSKEKKGIIYPSTFPKADFYYKHALNEGNPALKESASQFNDALLDEQAKEIESLRDKCKKYADILDSVGDKLRELKAENRRIKDSDLNLEGLAHVTRELKEKDKNIAELTEENEHLKDQVAVLYARKEYNENFDRKHIKRLGKEISKLNSIIHKKNLKIEELRKESSRHLRGKIKMFGENVDLEQMLKDKDAILSDVAEELRLSKIREKNLTEVSQKYMKENEELKKQLANKVVDKIDAQALKSAESALAYKEKVIEKLKKELEGTNNLVEVVRNGSREYCEYGVAAEKMIQKLAKIIVSQGLVPSEDFEKCRLWANGYRFIPQLSELSEDKENKIPSSGENHPIEDNPEEIEIEKAVKIVHKAMKEGHTVTIDYKD